VNKPAKNTLISRLDPSIQHHVHSMASQSTVNSRRRRLTFIAPTAEPHTNAIQIQSGTGAVNTAVSLEREKNGECNFVPVYQAPHSMKGIPTNTPAMVLVRIG